MDIKKIRKQFQIPKPKRKPLAKKEEYGETISQVKTEHTFSSTTNNSINNNHRRILFSQCSITNDLIKMRNSKSIPERIVNHFGKQLQDAQFEIEWKEEKGMKPANSSLFYFQLSERCPELLLQYLEKYVNLEDVEELE